MIITPRDELAGVCGARGKGAATDEGGLWCHGSGRPMRGSRLGRRRDDDADKTSLTGGSAAAAARRPSWRSDVSACRASRVGRDFFLKAFDRLTSGFWHGVSSSKPASSSGSRVSGGASDAYDADNLARLSDDFADPSQPAIYPIRRPPTSIRIHRVVGLGTTYTPKRWPSFRS